MSLTLPTSFNKSAIKQNWLFKLYYDNEGTNDFIGLSLGDTTVDSIVYIGAILNAPSIRESINLENSTAKTSNVSITVSNFIYNNDDFSAELFGGSRKYINRDVKIYIQPDDATALSDCVLVYTGRFTNINHNEGKISITISAKRVWDNIEVPNTKTNTSDNDNIYFPISYGDFSPNSSGDTINKKLRPVPFVQTIQDGKVFATSIEASTDNTSKGHLYINNHDAFLLCDSTENNSSSKLGGFTTEIRDNGKRYINLYPFQDRDESPTSTFGWNDKNNVFDRDSDSATSFAFFSDTQNTGQGTLTKNLYLNMPQLNFGNIIDDSSSLVIWVTYQITNVSGTGTIKIKGGFENDSTVLTATHTGSGNISETQDSIRIFKDTSSFPEYINLQHTVVTTDSGGFSYKLQISDIYLRVLYDDTVETFKDIEMAYIGENGLKDSGWASNSAITEIHEAHRDLLTRFTSYSGTPTNYSALNSLRDWKIRFWNLEPKLLDKILEKLQFEGGFIGRFNGQGDYSYHFIPDSPSASITLTKNDIENIDLSVTPFSSLVTKMEIEYEKHPSKSKYVNSSTSTNSSVRTAYNIDSAENIKLIRLDAYVSPTINTAPANASDKNDDFYRYYDHILGTPKIIVKSSIVNPTYFNVDVGDIIGFSDMAVDPFGESWSGKKFMITSTTRTPIKLTFTAREIS